MAVDEVRTHVRGAEEIWRGDPEGTSMGTLSSQDASMQPLF